MLLTTYENEQLPAEPLNEQCSITLDIEASSTLSTLFHLLSRLGVASAARFGNRGDPLFSKSSARNIDNEHRALDTRQCEKAKASLNERGYAFRHDTQRIN